MAEPLVATEKTPYGEGAAVEDAQKVTNELIRQNQKPAPSPAEEPAGPPQDGGFAGPKDIMQIPHAPPTYEAPFKTEMEKNQDVAGMLDLLGDRSPAWAAIAERLRRMG